MNESKPNKFKQIHIISLLIVLCFINNDIYCQQSNCEVLLEAIKGTYTGDCVKGKAHGSGKSVGTEMYEGEFKDGYPDGIGTYSWQDQEYYSGGWKKGKKDGNGEMHYKTAMGLDSLVKGFWKKGKYIGLFEKAFSIEAKSTRISNLECRISNKTGRNIYIKTHQLAGAGVMNAEAVIVSLSNISVLEGTYYTQSFQVLGNTGLIRLQNVSFPFKAIFYLSNGEQTEILFNEAGDYDVYINM